ncbi:CDGSH iron-sulfur domain-containing protein [Streptomyces sannanensis]|uniref:CDGSH iron-sulfur domain-containing protein n=1 Tax=Streptomyces sannanensis TaxID=285536 RepID=A0ABP6S436_9ACTN
MPDTSDRAAAGAPDPAYAATPVRRVFVDPQGPVVVEGPIEIALEDGAVVRSDRFMVAVCTCRRSRTYPWCDTSHRRRARDVSPPEDRNP